MSRRIRSWEKIMPPKSVLKTAGSTSPTKPNAHMHFNPQDRTHFIGYKQVQTLLESDPLPIDFDRYTIIMQRKSNDIITAYWHCSPIELKKLPDNDHEKPIQKIESKSLTVKEITQVKIMQAAADERNTLTQTANNFAYILTHLPKKSGEISTDGKLISKITYEYDLLLGISIKKSSLDNRMPMSANDSSLVIREESILEGDENRHSAKHSSTGSKRSSTGSNTDSKHSSVGSFVGDLKKDDTGISILDDEATSSAYPDIDQQIQLLSDEKAHELATAIFSNDLSGYKFAIKITQKVFFQSTKGIKIAPEIANQASINAERLTIFNNACNEASTWLQSISLPTIVAVLRKKIESLYNKHSFTALFLEQYLFEIIVNARNLKSYTQPNHLYLAIFFENINENFDTYHTKFAAIVSVIFQHYPPNVIENILFLNYLLQINYMENIINLSVDSENFQSVFSSQVQDNKKQFDLKLSFIINTLNPETPIWMLCYLLFYRRATLFNAPNIAEATTKEFDWLYHASLQNDGKPGKKFADQLAADFLTLGLSKNTYFKPDPTNPQRLILKTRSDLINYKLYLEYLKYAVAALYFLAIASLALLILMASKIIKSSSSTTSAACLIFALSTLICPYLGIKLRNFRQAQWAEVSQTLKIFSQKSSQLFPPSGDIEDGNTVNSPLIQKVITPDTN